MKFARGTLYIKVSLTIDPVGPAENQKVFYNLPVRCLE